MNLYKKGSILFSFLLLLTFSKITFAGDFYSKDAVPVAAAYQTIQFEVPDSIKEEKVVVRPSAQQECDNQCSAQQNDCNYWAENDEALQKCDVAKAQCNEQCKNLSANPPRAAAYY